MIVELPRCGIMSPEVVTVVPVAAPEKDFPLALFPELVLQVDPDVRDVILIGSALYAPDLARDYDLVVTTTSPGDKLCLFERILDVLEAVTDKPVDLILRRPGDAIGHLALPILVGQILFGGTQTVEEARISFDQGGGVMGSFKHALSWLRTAGKNIKAAENETHPDDKDIHYRQAFDALFHGAQEGGQTYLKSEDTRWGYIASGLPWPYSHNFRDMANILHVNYAYGGIYPKDHKLTRKEFDQWKGKVETFITELRDRALDRGHDR